MRAVFEDRPHRGPDPETLIRDLRAEQLLLETLRSVHEAEEAQRWEGARRILAITLGLSLLAGLLASSAIAGVAVLQVAATVLISLLASAIGFYFGGARRGPKSIAESAENLHHDD